MNLYERVENEVKRGLSGANDGIPIGFPVLNNYIGLRKKIYTLIFAGSGVGKSSFAGEAYILNPIDWYLLNKNTSPIKLKIHYFSLERNSTYIVCKWLCRKIFLDQGITIPVSKILGWTQTKLTHIEHDYVTFYKDYIGELEEIVTIHDGGINPTGVYKHMKEYATQNGKTEQISEFKKIYTPNNENLITEYIVDHQSRIRLETGLKTKKDAIDKLSEYLQMGRDYYGFSPLMIAQSGRQLGSLMYNTKLETFEPTPEQIMDSSIPYFDSDVCISLFDPIYFNTNAPTGHDANQLRDQTNGAKYYRSLKIHKNTWGESDIRKGLVFHGAVGTYKELPKAADCDENLYHSVLDNSYFLTN